MAAFADAHTAHAAAVAALNGGRSGSDNGGIGSGSPSVAPSISPLASMGMPPASHGSAVPDKLRAAAAAAAASKRKGAGRPRSGTIGIGADANADAATDADGDIGGIRGQQKPKRKPNPSKQEKKDQRDNMFEKIRKVMDLSAQEEWLNAQGRRTLRDPLDDEALSPSSTLFRGCMELYRVRLWSGEILPLTSFTCCIFLSSPVVC